MSAFSNVKRFELVFTEERRGSIDVPVKTNTLVLKIYNKMKDLFLAQPLFAKGRPLSLRAADVC